MILKVAVSVLLLFPSLRVAQGAIDQCSVPLKNIAVYEGDLNTLIYFPTSNNSVKWSIFATSNELTDVDIVNYNDAVDPYYTADYAFNSSGLIIKNATTTADYNVHHFATSGMYTAQCSGGKRSTFKFLVVRQGPTCSCSLVNTSIVQLTCSASYADSTYNPIVAIFTLYVNGSCTNSDTPQRTNSADGYAWDSTSSFMTAYSSSSTYQCGLTFGQPTEVQDSSVAMNAPSFSNYCSVTASEFGCTADTTTSPSGCPSSTMTTTRLPTTSTTSTTTATTTNSPSTSKSLTTPILSTFSTKSTKTTTNPTSVSTSSTSTTAKLSSAASTLITTTANSSASTSSTTTRLSVANPSSSTTTMPPTTAFPISMEPLFGPVAGGTNITITGSSPSDYPPSNSGSYIPDLGDAVNVYIGSDLHATLVPALSDVSSTFELVAVTQNTTEASIGQPLPIIIEFSSTLFNMAPFNMTFNKTFTYLPNPEITSLYPKSFIANGGILLDVTGRNLSSVAKPIIQLTVVITRAAENSSTSNTTTRFCTVPPDNDTYMLCPMPPLCLPDEFLEIVNLRYNTILTQPDVYYFPMDEDNKNETRKRRSRNLINHLIENSHRLHVGLLSRMKRDVNVLAVKGSNGGDLAEIYLGFILDGYKKYENINDVLPDTKLIFYSAPEINPADELIQFDPSEDELISVKGRYMMRGCRLRDYVVHVGNQTCINSDLQDNQLSCRPPKVEPSLTVNDTIYCNQHLSITITVGYKQYQYACLTYTDRSRRLALIIGLTVGLGVFAILLIVLIVCIVRCHKSKVREETDIRQHTGGVELRNRHSRNAERPGSKRDLNIIHTRQNPMTIYKPDDDYATSLQQESQQEYDQQIQEYDDYLKPNGDYLTSIDDE